MKYQEIKKKRHEDTNNLFTNLGVFWAFGNDQFKEGLDKLVAKGMLKSGEKLVSIGAGGFMPKTNFDKLTQGMKEIEETFKKEIKEANARTEHILYELNNHEAFYTGTIDDTLQALGEDYTAEEVTTVYKEYKKAKYKQNLTQQELENKYAN